MDNMLYIITLIIVSLAVLIAYKVFAPQLLDDIDDAPSSNRRVNDYDAAHTTVSAGLLGLI